MKKPLKIYIDGSSLGNPWPGGWAVVISDGHQVLEIISGWKATATNSEMELTALWQWVNKAPSNVKAYIYSDSNYIVNWATKRFASWEKRGGKKANWDPVAYWSLWQKIGKALKGKNIDIVWVKWHSWNKFNELADKQAKQQASKYQ